MCEKLKVRILLVGQLFTRSSGRRLKSFLQKILPKIRKQQASTQRLAQKLEAKAKKLFPF